MGPAATVDFMATVLARTPAGSDQEHVHMIVDNDPQIPARQAAILRGGLSPGPAIAAMARRLQAAGADFLVMPCNTAHAFSESITAAVEIPLVSIIDVTVTACREYNTVGLLATDGCLQSNVYQAAMQKEGIELLLPTATELAEFMQLTYRIKRGDTGDDVSAGMLRLAEALVQRGAQALVAGCTELPLVLNARSLEIPLVSSTDELAKRTIAIAQGTEVLHG
jgi:aspartate racemase